jgi:hypothetical protein
VLRRFSLVFAVILLLGLIAACGDDDDDDGSSGDSETIEATATTSEASAPTVTATLQANALLSTPTTDAPGDVQLVEPPEMPEGIPHDGRLLGEPDAAVQIVEYGDFQ